MSAIEIPIRVDMEVAESEQAFDMEVAEQIIVNPTSYTKLAEAEYAVNTTSTSVTIIGTIEIPTASDLWTNAHMIIVTARDKAGKRAGYFLGSDAIFSNPLAANGSGTSMTNPARTTYIYSANGEFATNNTNAGVYSYDIQSNGKIRIASRYNATSSLAVNGTYKVEVWALKYPNNVSPFV